MEYTKGEWALIEDEDTFQVYVPTKFTVAKIHKRWGDDAKANAHLIAAAPEMYEALKLFTERMSYYNYPIELELPKVWMEKAIAKVEGKG